VDRARDFRVDLSRDEVVERLGDHETLAGLLGEQTEIVERGADRFRTRTHYTALGREGTVEFVFSFLMDGGVRFEKICDGRVWKELCGELSVEEEGDGARVGIELHGKTKRLIPEFTIEGPMDDQLRDMIDALRTALG